MQSIFRIGRIECLVNPDLGREKEMAFQPTDNPKRVMVIGGGPGGLNAARIAAKRGHKVDLYEKKTYLGGQLNLGVKPYFKKELNHLLEFLITQVKKENVTCHMGNEITVDIVKKHSPDVVIIATGSSPFIPPIQGIDLPTVLSVPELLIGSNSSIGPKAKDGPTADC